MAGDDIRAFATRTHDHSEAYESAVDVSSAIATHTADVDAHHAKYLDSEAVTAMGVKGDANALNHDKYTDAEVDAIVATHTANASAHHVKYTDGEADARVAVHTGDATDAHDASAVSVLDAAGHFAAVNVETALAEAYDDFEAHDHDADYDALGAAAAAQAAAEATAAADVDADIITHAAITTAHHTKYTDAEAVDAVEAVGLATPVSTDTVVFSDAGVLKRIAFSGITESMLTSIDHAGPIATHAAIAGAHHVKYLDSEAVTAMGVKGDANALNHDKYTDAEVDAIVATHTADVDAHHAKYTDAEAVSALSDSYLACHGFRSTTQTFTNNTWETLDLNAELWDTGVAAGLSQMHDTTTNEERIIARRVGIFWVAAQMRFTAATAGGRGAQILDNAGFTVARMEVRTESSGRAQYVNIGGWWEATAVTDYVYLQGFQNSGGNLTSVNPDCWLAMEWRGINA